MPSTGSPCCMLETSGTTGLCSLPRRLRRTTSLRAGRLLAVCSLETVAPSGPGCSLPRAQRGRVSARRAAGCCRSPSPRQGRRGSRPAAGVRPAGHTASRPAQGEGGVRWRGGQPGVGRRWWGCYGKSGFISPILWVFLMLHWLWPLGSVARDQPIATIKPPRPG